MSAADLFDLGTLPAGDEGKTEMVLFRHPQTNKVVQRFARPMEFIAYDPGNAVAVAHKLIDVAVECGAQVTIQVPRRQVKKEVRDALVYRAMHIYRNVGTKKTPMDAARSVVDAILSSID